MSPTQIAISGTSDGLEAAEAPLKEAGARRYIRLKVSGPFHSPLLEEARKEFGDFLQGVTYSDPKIPIYANVTGSATSSGAEARELSIKQVVSTVRWVDEEKALLEQGVQRFLEVGPGKVLTGLLKGVTKELACTPVGTMEEIDKLGG